MNKIELETSIIEWIKVAAAEGKIKLSLINRAITLHKMTEDQLNDLWAMIGFFAARNTPRVRTLGDVLHDLNGFQAIYMGMPGADCFLPRSYGYTQRV